MSIEKKISQTDKQDLPIISFDSPQEWRNWLENNYQSIRGIWLRFYKKASGITSLNYTQALDEALCFGWIDGQLKKYDADSYLQKFTPRRAKSNWSKRNIEHIGRLKQEGKMTPSGLKEVEAAIADGRWGKAYDSPISMKIPEDFLIELSKDRNAFAFFEALSKANKYAIAWRLQTAKKAETREKRMKIILEMLTRGEKFHR
jgi:uncharacterized protein YdeI (YjbR/CyaY-like superfamily)